MSCPSVSLFLFVCLLDKDVLRTDREYPTYKSLTDPKIQQLEDVLRTYTMYNFDLGKSHYTGVQTCSGWLRESEPKAQVCIVVFPLFKLWYCIRTTV